MVLVVVLVLVLVMVRDWNGAGAGDGVGVLDVRFDKGWVASWMNFWSMVFLFFSF